MDPSVYLSIVAMYELSKAVPGAKNRRMCRFLCGPCCIKGPHAMRYSKNFSPITVFIGFLQLHLINSRAVVTKCVNMLRKSWAEVVVVEF
jgi:hypothetical protein